jgi:TolB-like protein
VLPLANLSPDSSNDYFADGLTDEIIRNLSIIEGLAVRSQTSSFAFKGKPQNIREAGRQLNVNYILEGSVLRSGGQLRVNVQLVRVNDDFPLWSGRYEREQADVLAIQDEISRGIVNSLRLKLGRGRRRYETSTDVYDLYLRARAVSVENGINGINNNIGSLEEVIARDPSFAPAYADLAGAYAIRSGEYRFNIPDEVSKMRAAAEKAVQLDPLLAQAHYAQGAVYARDGQWRDAEQSFRRAIELDPNDPTSRIGIAVYLLWSLGKTDQAVRQMREAEKADPLSPNVHELLANILISARRYREAASELEQLPADAALKSWLVSRVKIGEGRIDEAIQDLEAHYRRGGLEAGDQNWGELVYAYARGGRRRDAETVVATMPPNPINMVLAYAGLGDKDRVFEALDRASTGGAVRIGRTLTWPELAFIQSDPRVKQLRKKVRLPE